MGRGGRGLFFDTRIPGESTRGVNSWGMLTRESESSRRKRKAPREEPYGSSRGAGFRFAKQRERASWVSRRKSFCAIGKSENAGRSLARRFALTCGVAEVRDPIESSARGTLFVTK